MLQVKAYPEMVGKALVLEADPFLNMVEDDNPWVEGLFLVTCVGALLGAAHFLGGLLLTASLPPAIAVRETFVQTGQAFAPWLAPTLDPAQIELFIRQGWTWAAAAFGYQNGLIRLLFAFWSPFFLILQWLFLGAITHFAARALGGQGKLVQTMGATALAAAPQLLGVLTVIPFVSVSGLLLAVWALLIAYRAVEISHDLSWQRAALAVAAVPVVLLLLALGLSIIVGVVVALGGGL